MSTSFYPPLLPQLDDWLHRTHEQEHTHEQEQKCVHWNANKGRQRLLDFWQSAVDVEEPDVPADNATPVRQAEKPLEERFLEEANKWERETAHLSSPLQRMENLSYQAIMGMSAESPEHKRTIIRLMLRDLRTKQRDWFLALSYLTQQNPISPKDYGKTSKLVQAWVKWGKEQGYF